MVAASSASPRRLVADARVAALVGDPRLGNAELTGLLLPPDEASRFGVRGSFSRCWSRTAAPPLLPDIAALFEEFKREAERVLKVTVRSATPVSDAAGRRDQAGAEEALRPRHRTRAAHRSSVIGGAVIDAGDVVIDGSVRGRLARLESALTQ